MIFAAGLGIRLGELTAHKPKALVEVNGKTMLEHVVTKLKSWGISDIIINIHHFGDLIRNYLLQQQNFGIHIEISDESDELLDTGGGLIKAAHFFTGKDPFIAHNVDVLSNTSIGSLLNQYYYSYAMATLVVKRRETSRYLLINDDDRLCGWRNKKTNEEIISYHADNPIEIAFSGIQIINPKIFQLNTLKGKFSLTQMYLDLSTKSLINVYKDDSLWFDLGSPENIKEAEAKFFIR